jgi:hypothetical protein
MLNNMENKMKRNETNIQEIGFAGLLTIVFITLKLTGVIEWGWVWVLSPLWISWAFVLGIALMTLIVIGIHNVVRKFVKD